jgi:GNAT superfamily N-acetyltransferase
MFVTITGRERRAERPEPPTTVLELDQQRVMDLRRAGTEDSLEIAELWLRSRRASVPAIPPPVHSDDEVRSWFADVVLPDREVWVAHAEGVAVGLMVLDGKWLDQLYVAPELSGAGIGSRLVELAKRRRPAGLQLWTFQANTGARRFYERHGFVAVDSTDGDNEEGAPDVRYEWPGRPH